MELLLQRFDRMRYKALRGITKTFQLEWRDWSLAQCLGAVGILSTLAAMILFLAYRATQQ